jgi:hypothetical protein
MVTPAQPPRPLLPQQPTDTAHADVIPSGYATLPKLARLHTSRRSSAVVPAQFDPPSPKPDFRLRTATSALHHVCCRINLYGELNQGAPPAATPCTRPVERSPPGSCDRNPATLRAALTGRARSRPGHTSGVPGWCAAAADAIINENQTLAAGQANRMGRNRATLRYTSDQRAIPPISPRGYHTASRELTSTAPSQPEGGPLTRRGVAGLTVDGMARDSF